jgi:hypothetical protein
MASAPVCAHCLAKDATRAIAHGSLLLPFCSSACNELYCKQVGPVLADETTLLKQFRAEQAQLTPEDRELRKQTLRDILEKRMPAQARQLALQLLALSTDAAMVQFYERQIKDMEAMRKMHVARVATIKPKTWTAASDQEQDLDVALPQELRADVLESMPLLRFFGKQGGVANKTPRQRDELEYIWMRMVKKRLHRVLGVPKEKDERLSWIEYGRLVTTLFDYLVLRPGGSVWDYAPLLTSQLSPQKPFLKLYLAQYHVERPVDPSVLGSWLTILNSQDINVSSLSPSQVKFAGVTLVVWQGNKNATYWYPLGSASKSGDTLRWGPAQKLSPASTLGYVEIQLRNIAGKVTLSGMLDLELNYSYVVLSPEGIAGMVQIDTRDIWRVEENEVALEMCQMPLLTDLAKLPAVRTLGDLRRWRDAASSRHIEPFPGGGAEPTARGLDLRLRVPIYPYMTEEVQPDGSIVPTVQLAIDLEQTSLIGVHDHLDGPPTANGARSAKHTPLRWNGDMRKLVRDSMYGSGALQLNPDDHPDVVASIEAMRATYRESFAYTFFARSDIPAGWTIRMPEDYGTVAGAGFHLRLPAETTLANASYERERTAFQPLLGHMVQYPSADPHRRCIVYVPLAPLRPYDNFRKQLPLSRSVLYVTKNDAAEGIAQPLC